jgi:hypothetical protein
MLYAFDVAGKKIDPLTRIDPGAAGVKENDIEKAIADRPTSIFRREANELPLLIVKKSVQGAKMADIIALDADGRLVVVECKRGWADRDTLAQLLDYASEYHPKPMTRLKQDWSSGEGAQTGRTLLDRFREFADDPSASEDRIGKQRVLVVVAAGKDDGFERIARMMRADGVEVYFVPVKVFRRGNGELFLEVEPTELRPAGAREPADVSADFAESTESSAETDDGTQVWMINTDEAHSPGATQRFLEKGVAAVWGYEDGPAVLQRGVRTGDAIYAYSNGHGIVARGTIANEDVVQATPENAVIPQCKDGNEWHLRVTWAPAFKTPVANSDVRAKAGIGLPVRNSFCRLWDKKVQAFLVLRSKT